MNINRLAAKRALDLQRSAGIFDHPQHDQMLCNYADAAAEDVMKEIQEQLPKIVSETVDRYMNSKSVEVKVDEASVKSVKSKITDLFYQFSLIQACD